MVSPELSLNISKTLLSILLKSSFPLISIAFFIYSSKNGYLARISLKVIALTIVVVGSIGLSVEFVMFDVPFVSAAISSIIFVDLM